MITKKEYPEYNNDANNETNDSKVIRQPLNRKEVSNEDVSSFIAYSKNGKTLVPAIPKKTTAYNPGEVPYLKQLLQNYDEGALTFTIVFWD